jgi:hypothetical protein
VWAAGGLNGRLGATKRRMLSLGERLSWAEVLAGGGAAPLTGTTEGIVADCNGSGGYQKRRVLGGRRPSVYVNSVGTAMRRGSGGRRSS